MEVLVTGAPGWLGTELVGQLVEADHDVRCLTLPGQDTSELDPYDVAVYRGDVRYRDTLQAALDGGVDVLFHCAAAIHPPDLLGDHLFYEVNADGTRNLLEAARRHGVDHFVYLSSNAAQGFNDSPDRLMTEEMPCRPESSYGESKYVAEQHVRRYHRKYGIEYTITRPCWFYGERQPRRMNRLMGMIAGGTPVVFGDGTNLRSMTYVPSLARALVTIAENPGVSKGETYWLADERPYTTNYIYRTIATHLGVADDLRPVYVPTPVSRAMGVLDRWLATLGVYERHVHVAGEMSRHVACDPSKAMAELGWDPPRDLTDGMQESVEWALDHGKI